MSQTVSERLTDLLKIAQQGAGNGILDLLTLDSVLFNAHYKIPLLCQPQRNNEKGNGLSLSLSPYLFLSLCGSGKAAGQPLHLS